MSFFIAWTLGKIEKDLKTNFRHFKYLKGGERERERETGESLGRKN
jgi:hypothetical protein